MELLLMIPLAVGAAGLYWLFKSPFAAESPNENPEQAPVLPTETENVSDALATVHAAPVLRNKPTGE